MHIHGQKDPHKYTKYTLEKKIKKRNNRDQSLSWTINLNWTFTDTNSGIKKNPKGTLKSTIYFLKMT